jgi:predicted XRE-type DNA-binding protein
VVEMKYSNEQLLKIEEKAKKNRKKFTHITNKQDLSTEDKVKLGLCRHFVQFAISNKLKMKSVAQMIDLPVTRLSEIVNYKINKFSVDFLLKYLSSLAKQDAQIREYLNFFGLAAELPVLSVTRTKKLTKDLKEAAMKYDFSKV